MTIASKTNLLRISFIGLGLGKGLTTDYTNNADGEGLRRTTNKVFRPTKQTKRHEKQLHSFVLFGVFRGQTFDTFCPVGVISVIRG
jgi:hypothetical protein